MNYEEREALRHRRIGLNCSLPITLVEVMDKLSEAEGRPLSEIAARLIRTGLKVERAERERKLQAV